jgi:hypothetical protein
MLECIEVVFVYVGSKLLRIFIFNKVNWLFPSNLYLGECMIPAWLEQTDKF